MSIDKIKSNHEQIMAVFCQFKNHLIVNGKIVGPTNVVYSLISEKLNNRMSAASIYKYAKQMKGTLLKMFACETMHNEKENFILKLRKRRRVNDVSKTKSESGRNFGDVDDPADKDDKMFPDQMLLIAIRGKSMRLDCTSLSRTRLDQMSELWHHRLSYRAVIFVVQIFKMAFPKSSKTSRSWSLESMRQALQAVDGGMSIRSSAELFGIPRNTLTSYVASELRPDDEMKFMENFDPEKSKREQRKLNRKFSNVSKRSSLYDDKGIHTKTGLDLCDCLNDKCEGCFFACLKCRSFKCGQECRQNRRWMYESYRVQGSAEVVKNRYLDD